jgi:hypothetical protein
MTDLNFRVLPSGGSVEDRYSAKYTLTTCLKTVALYLPVYLVNPYPLLFANSTGHGLGQTIAMVLLVAVTATYGAIMLLWAWESVLMVNKYLNERMVVASD